MKTLNAFFKLLMTLACPLCFAQDVAQAPSRYATNLAQPVVADFELSASMSVKRQKIESVLQGYLVAFDASHDAQRHVRVGLPLTSFANNLVQMAYDIADHGVMLQWNLAKLSHQGTQWKFNAFVSQSKTTAITVSASF